MRWSTLRTDGIGLLIKKTRSREFDEFDEFDVR